MTTEVELPVLNVDLLRQVMAQIEAYPESWNQGNWFRKTPDTECGTTACFAGWTCQLTGWEPLYGEDMPVAGLVMRKGSTEVAHAHETAVAELGLTNVEASRLFFAPTDFATLQDLVEQIIDGVYRPQVAA